MAVAGHSSAISVLATRLSADMALQSSPLFLGGAIWPEAMANGLLTSQQALRRQVVSHCQAALIRSYNSCRDSQILEALRVEAPRTDKRVKQRDLTVV